MNKFEFIRPWPSLPTTQDESSLPVPVDVLSDEERQVLQQVADGVVLDQTQPSPLPVLHDLYIAEPQHPVVVEPEV